MFELRAYGFRRTALLPPLPLAPCAPPAGRAGVDSEGGGAFRRFKDVLHRWPDLVDRWYGFSDDRRIGRARAWLADAGYRPADSR